MKLIQKYHSQKSFLPKVYSYIDNKLGLVSVAFSWGDPDSAKKVVGDICQFVQSTLSEVEVTSPFDRLEHLSSESNALRIGTILSHDNIYRNSNSSSYIDGIEVMTFIKKDHMLAWAHVGQPNLVILRNGKMSTALTTSFFSDYDSLGKACDKLPFSFLGIEATCPVVAGQINLNKNDRIFLTTSQFCLFKNSILDFQQIFDLVKEQNSQTTFWLCEVV